MQTGSRQPPAGFVPQAESQGFRAGALSTGPHCHLPKKTIHSKQLTTSFGFSPDENTLERCDVGPKAARAQIQITKLPTINFKLAVNVFKLLVVVLPTNYLSIARNRFRSSSSWAWTFSALAFWVRNTSLSCCRFAMRSSTICRQFSSAWMKTIYIVDSPSFTLIRPTDHLSVKKPTQWFWDKPSFWVVHEILSHSVGPTLALRLLEIGNSYLSLSFILDSFLSLMPSDFCSHCPMKTFLLLGPLNWQPDNRPHVLFPAWWGFWLYALPPQPVRPLLSESHPGLTAPHSAPACLGVSSTYSFNSLPETGLGSSHPLCPPHLPEIAASVSHRQLQLRESGMFSLLLALLSTHHPN